LKVVAHIFQESLENTTSLLVDQTRDTLDTSTTSKTTDGRLGDALDVVTKDLPVTLGSSLSESLLLLNGVVSHVRR
jgi:ABC-type transporter Mla subunit MlaD